MKSISAYRSEDGSIHESREGAAVSDLSHLGFSSDVAAQMIERRSEVEKVFQQVSGLAYLPTYFPPPTTGEDAA